MKNKKIMMILILFIISLFSLITIPGTISKHNSQVSYYVKYLKLNNELFYLRNHRYASDLQELMVKQNITSIEGYEDSISYQILDEGTDCMITGNLWLQGPIKAQCL